MSRELKFLSAWVTLWMNFMYTIIMNVRRTAIVVLSKDADWHS